VAKTIYPTSTGAWHWSQHEWNRASRNSNFVAGDQKSRAWDVHSDSRRWHFTACHLPRPVTHNTTRIVKEPVGPHLGLCIPDPTATRVDPKSPSHSCSPVNLSRTVDNSDRHKFQCLKLPITPTPGETIRLSKFSVKAGVRPVAKAINLGKLLHYIRLASEQSIRRPVTAVRDEDIRCCNVGTHSKQF